jgi:hypothetical protein
LLETGEDYRERDLLDQVAKMIKIFGLEGAGLIVGCPDRRIHYSAWSQLRRVAVEAGLIGMSGAERPARNWERHNRCDGDPSPVIYPGYARRVVGSYALRSRASAWSSAVTRRLAKK